jgi:folate-binding protein YgfZ
VRKYVNPRLARYADESASLQVLGVYGVQARYVIEQMTGVGHTALSLLTDYAHISVAIGGAPAIVMRSPDLGVEGYDLFVPADSCQATWDAAVAARATPAGLTAWEIARVEAGRPEWGLDMDEGTIAQEANLDELGAISYTKGCYTGQEVVARVHFRGHVNRTIRGLRASGTTPPAYLAALFDATGKAVGEVHSTASSPRLGGIALGMVRREVDVGAQLMARWNADLAGDVAAGETLVDVGALPFPAEQCPSRWSPALRGWSGRTSSSDCSRTAGACAPWFACRTRRDAAARSRTRWSSCRATCSTKRRLSGARPERTRSFTRRRTSSSAADGTRIAPRTSTGRSTRSRRPNLRAPGCCT